MIASTAHHPREAPRSAHVWRATAGLLKIVDPLGQFQREPKGNSTLANLPFLRNSRMTTVEIYGVREPRAMFIVPN